MAINHKPPFTQYSSVASLKQAEGADTAYRTIKSDQKTKQMGVPSEKIFDKKEPIEKKTNIYLNEDFSESKRNPIKDFLAVKIEKNGMSFNDIKSEIKPEKKR